MAREGALGAAAKVAVALCFEERGTAGYIKSMPVRGSMGN